MPLHPSIFDHEGNSVQLGQKLGTGGEGSVFEVPSRGRDIVAKIYHQSITAEKHAKLSGMVQSCDDQLKQVAAWPLALLHVGRNGPARGFLMPRVTGYEAVHNLYGPAHRKAKFPKADWAFLVQAARNVAAAFDAIHTHGHIVGDVNQGNVFVASNALTRLIDCDSFQINAGNTEYLCEVGVPHFTAPELQHAHTFRGVRRSKDHDAFGLAILIFHLLFMGRHPFAGVYAGKEDMPIERAIKEFRFAFGLTASTRKMSRPPQAVGPEIASAEVAQLFELAFSDRASQAGRPGARSWVQALDAMKRDVRACGLDSMHKFYGKLSACPWCDLERRAGLTFFIGIIGSPVHTSDSSNFDLNAVWRKIESLQTAVPPIPIDPSSIPAVGAGIPIAVKVKGMKAVVTRTAVILGAVALIALSPQYFWFWGALAIWIWNASSGKSAIDIERENRRTQLRLAEEKWREFEIRWRNTSLEEQLKRKLAELKDFKHEFQHLRTNYDQAKKKLETSARERQLQKFLSQFFIDDAEIPKIGAGRKSTLASFGIETAADIQRNRVSSVKGFGEGLTAELLQWRASLESRFRFDATRAIDPNDLQTVTRRFAQRRVELCAQLNAGPEAIQRLLLQAEQRRRPLIHSGKEVALALAQARADLAVF